MTPVGKMDQRIEVKRLTRTPDAYGGSVDTWDTIDTVWAAIKPMQGREVLDGQRTSPETRYRATIWWKGDANGAPYFTAEDKVVWQGRDYGIESVVPVGRNVRLELRLVEGAVS